MGLDPKPEAVAGRHGPTIPPLNEIVGLPPTALPAELDRASETCFQAMLDRASRGDADAQHEVVALRVAYLNWAYANSRTEVTSAMASTARAALNS